MQQGKEHEYLFICLFVFMLQGKEREYLILGES